MKMYGGVGVQLHVGIKWKMSGQHNDTVPLTPEKKIPVHLGQESEWAPNRLGAAVK
jgi:hypothetical protein